MQSAQNIWSDSAKHEYLVFPFGANAEPEYRVVRQRYPAQLCRRPAFTWAFLRFKSENRNNDRPMTSRLQSAPRSSSTLRLTFAGTDDGGGSAISPLYGHALTHKDRIGRNSRRSGPSWRNLDVRTIFRVRERPMPGKNLDYSRYVPNKTRAFVVKDGGSNVFKYITLHNDISPNPQVVVDLTLAGLSRNDWLCPKAAITFYGNERNTAFKDRSFFYTETRYPRLAT
ncbi:hypothetical protein F5Y07DRAFT_47675 [Xylaria sp. FL0933]|nr:hypothetical protein F5Y07DRAFT_47675 [Xylaria sp. FL0933]